MARAPALVLLLLATASTARAGELAWGQRYAHAGHADKLAKAGKPAVACSSCHALDKKLQPLPPGKRNHKPCTDCHVGAGFSRGPRCLTCHSSIQTFRPGRPWFPPWRSPGEFHVAFAHARHVAALAATPQPCGDCHAKESGRPTPPSGHAQCGSCHAATAGQSAPAKPEMTTCDGCHQPGPPPPPVAATPDAGLYRVTARFSHVEHERKSGARGAAAACVSCHLGLGAADAPERPLRPPMTVCESCHDGKAAFDARGVQCGKCHAAPPTPPTPSSAPPDATIVRAGAFDHVAHGKRAVAFARCTDCHGVGVDWRATVAGHDQHKPCQGCHAAEFRRPNAFLCLGCHERSDPFAPNPLRQPSGPSQWRLADLPHRPHLAGGIACARCHQDEAHQPRRDADGHALCGRCHKEGAPTPLGKCAACHESAATPRPRPARPWSTHDRFRHDANHAVECARCHQSAGALELTPPTMRGCGESCHDGTRAFKVTGFGCVRCHGSGPRR